MKIILTGFSGMVGEGILMECLQNNHIEEVLMVNRKHIEFKNPKLKELVLPDFKEAKHHMDALKGYDACFYCAGISALGLTEAVYHDITYDTTIEFASALKEINANIIFNFVSGAYTDSTEKGKAMWARVKGKTENALLQLFPGKQYNFRPGLMKPMKGQKNFKGYNKWLPFLYPIFAVFMPACTIQDIARAMIHATENGHEKSILEVADIKKLSKNLDQS